jgi:hypothetical protein
MVAQRRRPGAARLLPSLLLAFLAACGSGGSPTPSPVAHRAAAASYLLTLDQLHISDFTVAEPAHRVDATALAAGDSALLGSLRAAGVEDAATVRYFRQVDDLATSNGFIDVRSTVLRLAGADGAHTAFLAEEHHTDAVPHIVPESSGVLGDESHADQLVETGPDGVQVVETTLIFRNANLVELLVVRGRLGATSLGDAILLGRAQLLAQQPR